MEIPYYNCTFGYKLKLLFKDSVKWAKVCKRPFFSIIIRKLSYQNIYEGNFSQQQLFCTLAKSFNNKKAIPTNFPLFDWKYKIKENKSSSNERNKKGLN